MRTETGLISLLRSTLAGLEEDAAPQAGEAAVSDLKRTVLRQVADLELRKAEAAKMEHATEVASLLARAGRAAYVVDPAAAKATMAAGEPMEFAQAEPLAD